MKILLQMAIVFGVCLVGEGVATLLPFAFPASAIAMILLFLCFFFRVLRVKQVEQVSRFLLENMALFFIPAGVGILDCIERVRGAVIPILVICAVSTFVTFTVTAYTVRLTAYFINRCKRRRQNRV